MAFYIAYSRLRYIDTENHSLQMADELCQTYEFPFVINEVVLMAKTCFQLKLQNKKHDTELG